MLFFSIFEENNEVIAENPFQNNGVTSAWPSWIDARRQYILLVSFNIALRQFMY